MAINSQAKPKKVNAREFYTQQIKDKTEHEKKLYFTDQISRCNTYLEHLKNPQGLYMKDVVDQQIFDVKRMKRTLIEMSKELSTRLYRSEYTDFQWFNLMKAEGEDLPNEYCDIFDRHGEISEEYEHIFDVNICETRPRNES